MVPEAIPAPSASSPAHPQLALPIAHPSYRRLRAYSFDPSLSLDLDKARINQVTLKVPWEVDPETGADILKPGPVGEYLEVVDVDPASDCFYAPVNLNNPYLLAQDGLAPAEGNPQFHQQMVYAVAMTTIRNFERALGRVAFWSPRAWNETPDPYVQRLRIYPHALREANAYYSPSKKALLFGYFPATTSDVRDHLPGGMVFSCLSHDVIAHETTHALLDGMHQHFDEATNPDVLAFHEGFADIVALFQHFSFPEVLRHQIARTSGDLATENLLAQLAQEFGQATEAHGALRDALGTKDPVTKKWQPSAPDPAQLQSTTEPHARGSILVAAIFDAFVSIYKSRTADLIRIATAGSGILPSGQLHPDLVNRLAAEAATSAQHILTMCIRALDYSPPFDITFGDYLRALVTADYDLTPDDEAGYRLAVIEAFRRRGIYPLDVRSLSTDSLRWSPPDQEDFRHITLTFLQGKENLAAEWTILSHRRMAYEHWQKRRAALHTSLIPLVHSFQKILGLDFPDPSAKFEVHSLRPARHVGSDGQAVVDFVIEVIQQRPGYFDPKIQAQVDDGTLTSPPLADFTFRGGCTLLVDTVNAQVRYCISKRIDNDQRLTRQRDFLKGDSDASLQALYFGDPKTRFKEPFAFLHRSVGQKE